MKLKKEWSTHLPLLIKAVFLSKGPVMELGAGIYSTPILHWLCAESGRKLVTYETVPEYYAFARKFRSRSHSVVFIKDWKNIDTKTHWGTVLVDQDHQRGETAILLKDKADYIILHDSGDEKLYGYDKALPHFKEVYCWKFCKPYTTVVSNFKDLSRFKDILA